MKMKTSYNHEPESDMVKLGIALAAIIAAAMLIFSCLGCQPQPPYYSSGQSQVAKYPSPAPEPDVTPQPWHVKGPLVYFPESK